MRNLSKRCFAVPFTAAALSLGAGHQPKLSRRFRPGRRERPGCLDDIALDLNVDVSQIPVTVQAPIGVAANVCDVNANVLAERRDGGAECDAESTSTALNRIVQRQIKRQG